MIVNCSLGRVVEFEMILDPVATLVAGVAYIAMETRYRPAENEGLPLEPRLLCLEGTRCEDARVFVNVVVATTLVC